MPPAIDPKVKRRAAELVGLGASYPEAAKAVGISLGTVEAMMRDPQWRAVRDQTTASKGGGLLKDALDVLKAGATATFQDSGDANMLVQMKAAEAILKNKDVIEKMVGATDEYDDLEGAIRVYPGVPCPHCKKPLILRVSEE